MEGTIGEIRMFAGNFAPRSWSFCDGSPLSIAVYDALYAVIGTTYGGDGVNTFNVPDLRGRAAVGTGQGMGLPAVQLGEVSGTESISMNQNQMPAHSHIGAATISIPAYGESDTIGSPTDAVLGGLPGAYSTQPADTYLATEPASVTLAVAGGGMPFSIMQPYSASNYIICLEGIFPTRS